MAALWEVSVEPSRIPAATPSDSAAPPCESRPPSAVLIWAAHWLPGLAVVARVLILCALFVLVVVLQVAVSSGLGEAGLAPGLAFAAAGACVLCLVLAVHAGLMHERRLAHAAREAARRRQGLPEGPCCVVWRPSDADWTPPWEAERRMRVVHPPTARSLSVEGIAVAEFEIDQTGAAANITCVEAWPSMVFFRRAKSALAEARFRPRAGRWIGLGERHRIAFVFRIPSLHRQKARRPSPSPLNH